MKSSLFCNPSPFQNSKSRHHWFISEISFPHARQRQSASTVLPCARILDKGMKTRYTLGLSAAEVAHGVTNQPFQMNSASLIHPINMWNRLNTKYWIKKNTSNLTAVLDRLVWRDPNHINRARKKERKKSIPKLLQSSSEGKLQLPIDMQRMVPSFPHSA